jgi:hypothetical protein
MRDARSRGRRGWVNALLLVPCIAALAVPLYNFDEPRTFGIPFFYAWQLLWIWLGAGFTWLVYVLAWKDRDR